MTDAGGRVRRLHRPAPPGALARVRLLIGQHGATGPGVTPGPRRPALGCSITRREQRAALASRCGGGRGRQSRSAGRVEELVRCSRVCAGRSSAGEAGSSLTATRACARHRGRCCTCIQGVFGVMVQAQRGQDRILVVGSAAVGSCDGVARVQSAECLRLSTSSHAARLVSYMDGSVPSTAWITASQARASWWSPRSAASSAHDSVLVTASGCLSTERSLVDSGRALLMAPGPRRLAGGAAAALQWCCAAPLRWRLADQLRNRGAASTVGIRHRRPTAR